MTLERKDRKHQLSKGYKAMYIIDKNKKLGICDSCAPCFDLTKSQEKTNDSDYECVCCKEISEREDLRFHAEIDRQEICGSKKTN